MNLIQHISVIIAASMALSSCIADGGGTLVPAEPETDGAQAVCGVRFELSLPVLSAPAAASRADGYDPGSADYENYIDVASADYRFYFFSYSPGSPADADANNRYIGTFKPGTVRVEAVPDASSTRSKRYIVVGELEQVLPLNFKIVAMANCGSYPDAELVPGVTTIASLAEASAVSIDPAQFSLGHDFIPMFGIKECTDMHFYNGLISTAGTMHMLRAMAKVEVTSADGDSSLASVRLDRANGTALPIPSLSFYLTDEYVKGDYDLDYVPHVSLLGDANDASHQQVPFGTSTGADGATLHTLYVPEYRNTGADELSTSMSLTFDNSGVSYRLDFKDYATGEPFDIQRNYYYRYVVRRTAMDLEVTVQVFPYTVKDLFPEFGIEKSQS